MASIRDGLSLTEGSTEHLFGIVETEGQLFSLESRAWEPGDPTVPWRKALHPFHMGLTESKLVHPYGYSKANADLTFPGIMVPPPLLNTITNPTTTIAEVIHKRAQADAETTGGTSLVINKPTGTVDNDVMLAILWTGGNPALTAPAGWVADEDANDAAAYRLAVYHKVASSEGATYTWSWAGAQNAQGLIITFTGVDTTTPVDDSSIQVEAAGTDHASAAVTPTVAGNRLVAGIVLAATGTLTQPSGMAEEFDDDSNGRKLGAASIHTDSTSAVTKNFTSSNATASIVALVSLKRKSAAASIVSAYEWGTEFNTNYYLAAGRYLVQVTSSYAASVIKDFGSTQTIESLDVYENELTLTLTTGHLWTMDTSGNWVESPDVFATFGAKQDDKFWIVQEYSKILNCITGATSLANYAPASPNQYRVGDSDSAHPIIKLISYQGEIWAVKTDGLYAPDFKSEFHNQVPQVRNQIDTHMGYGSFVSTPYLFFPTRNSGMFRVLGGSSPESIPVGPELTNRPTYAFSIWSGFEWGGVLYLGVQNSSGSSDESFICKMIPDKESPNGYRFHEWCRIGAGYYPFTMGMFVSPTNPTIMIGNSGASIKLQYIKLGRGSGKYIDDTLYGYGLAWELETGNFLPVDDMSIKASLVGVKVICDMDSSESLSLSYEVDGAGSFTNLLNEQESGGGTAPIASTSGYDPVFRYAAPNITGNFFNVKLTGSNNAGTGSDRPEVREVWAFGDLIPETTDLLTFTILADPTVEVFGLKRGKSQGEILRQFRAWKNAGTVLTMKITEYEDNRTTRVNVGTVKDTRLLTYVNEQERHVDAVVVTLKRIDFAQGYSDA